MKKYILVMIAVFTASFIASCSNGDSPASKATEFFESVKDKLATMSKEELRTSAIDFADIVKPVMSKLEEVVEKLISSNEDQAKVLQEAGIAEDDMLTIQKVVEDFIAEAQKNPAWNELMNDEEFSRKWTEAIGILNKQDLNVVDIASVQSSYDFKGAVYRYPITMHIDIEGDKVEGFLYYNRKGPKYKLYLSGTLNGDEIVLVETDVKQNETGGFQGKLNNDTFKGTYTRKDGVVFGFIVSTAGTDVGEVLEYCEELALVDNSENLSNFDEYNGDGDASIDEFLDEYERFWKRYMNFVKKVDKNDPSFLVEYGELWDDYQSYANKIEKMRGKMSAKQIERINRMNMELLQEAQKLR